MRCQAARIQQVVVALVLNAIDACESDDSVTVSTRYEPQQGGVTIEVSDTGSGIEPSVRERIFEPFFTTKAVGQGTGLGLSISYGIVEQHHGSIDVQSAPGSGSCFTIRLPVQPKRSRVDGPMAAERVTG